MQKNSTKPSSRREMLLGVGRGVAASGLAIVSVILAGRKNTTLPGQKCVSDGLCRYCNVMKDCSLPQAVSVRKVLDKQ